VERIPELSAYFFQTLLQQFSGRVKQFSQIGAFGFYTLIIMLYIYEASINLCYHSMHESGSQHLLSALVFWGDCCLVHRAGQTRRQNWTAECFILTLFYLGCQRIMWKINTGQKVRSLYFNWKNIGLVSWIEPNFKQTVITWTWGISYCPIVNISLCGSDCSTKDKKWRISITPT